MCKDVKKGIRENLAYSEHYARNTKAGLCLLYHIRKSFVDDPKCGFTFLNSFFNYCFSEFWQILTAKNWQIVGTVGKKKEEKRG